MDVVNALRAAGCVFAEDEAALLLDAAAGPDLAALVTRRVAGEPLEHLLGRVEFDGLRLAVGPGVFVPRQRTVFLVERAAEGLTADSVVLDLCCGCGAVGAAIAHRTGARPHAADIDPVAVGYARRNLGERVYQGDLFDAVPPELRGRVDVVVCNAPYVPSAAVADMPPEARDHEPRAALDGGADGLAVHRRVAAEAPRWLAPGGRLLIETGRDQARLAVALFAEVGLAATVTHDDEVGATVVTGTVSGARAAAS